jgi:hypothetical protein
MDTPEWIDYQKQFDLGPEYFQAITDNTRKLCVIVEPRCHERLILVIKNFMYLLQTKGWGLLIFHGRDNKEFLENGLSGWPNVHYIEMPLSNMSAIEYSNMLCEPLFWRILINMGCHHSLIFQIDTVLLKDTVDDFLEYDYVGAPWCVQWLGVLEVGNGGLSLRNVWKCLMITQQCPRTLETPMGKRHLTNEDIYFCYHLKLQNANIPTVETALKFSIETVFYEDPCGMHQPHIGRFPSHDAFTALFTKRWDIQIPVVKSIYDISDNCSLNGELGEN